MKARPTLPPDIEELRDVTWRRQGDRQVDSPADAERFVDEVGFAACLTDSRRPGPSLYVAVCGRRDAVLPHNVQKDPESSRTWLLKDELVRRGRVYYAKFGTRTLFIAPRLVPYFHAVRGIRRADEAARLSSDARAMLRVLRREWEISTADLRADAGITDRAAFTRALDELQSAMLVVPSEVYYAPRFTYIYTLAVGRFPDALRRRISREVALREIARAFLTTATLTTRGELARVTGLSRAEAGLGNRALVAEGVAEMLGTGVYRLAAVSRTGRRGRPGADGVTLS